jgi:hypothetical protein
MSSNMMFSTILMVVGGLTAISAFLYSMYKIAKRIDAAIGVDEKGRTLSDRMSKVEHQLWPNGGSSLADQVNKANRDNQKIIAELGIVKSLMIAMVTPAEQPSAVVKQMRKRKSL